MASVARAIEQAAPRTVDRSLWWESHKVLLEDMYAFSGESQIEDNKQRILEERLKNQEKWLLEMLLCFKGPNVASDEALKGSKVSIGSHSLDIKPDLKNTALQISKHLDLDEVQSYLLLTRYLEKEDLADDSSVLLQNELYINRRVPVYDVDALVQALCSTLQLIDTILLSFISTEFSTVPVFCQSLFQKSSIIASYLVFHRSSELQILSARM